MTTGDPKMFDQWKEAALRQGRAKLGEQHRRKRQGDRDKLRAEIARLRALVRTYGRNAGYREWEIEAALEPKP